MWGAKHGAEAPDSMVIPLTGRGAFHTGRSTIVKSCGQYGRENDGMSSEKYAENIFTESPRFPGEGSSAQGQAGPKARPKGAADGQQADNPALRMIVKTEAVKQKAMRAG